MPPEKKKDAPNQPETYLNREERYQVGRLLGFPEEFPQKFIAWLDDHLKVNIPQFPVTQIKGFQSFLTDFQNFILGEGASWPFIEGKGDLIVGFEPQTVTVLSSSAQTAGNILIANAAEPSGLEWVTPAEAVSSVTSLSSGDGQFEIVFAPDEALTTGDGKAYILIPDDLGGTNLIDADAGLVTVSSSGNPAIQIHNVTQTADMLSTKITIDSGERSSYSAAAPPVIDAGNDDVATGDLLRVDVDVAGTDAEGLIVILTFG